MSILSIIQNQSRSEADRQTAFLKLMGDHSITNLIQYSEMENWDLILDNLRMVSKSRLQLWQYCSFQFKMRYILHYTPEMYRRIMIDGKNLHLINKQFWETITVEEILTTENIEELIKEIYIRLIPQNERTVFIDQMIQNFIWFETTRIQGIFQDVEKTIENIKLYVIPYALELPIENWENNLIGIIDRIDRLTNGTFAVIEYKYGKPKYYQKNPMHKTFINGEIAFYEELLQGNQIYILVGDELKPFQEILGDIPHITYGAMLFFQDIQATSFLFELKKISITTIKRKIGEYWKALDTGIFLPKPSNACLTVCEYYWDQCELNNEFLEIEKCMDDSNV